MARAGRGIFSVDRWNLLSLHDAATTGRATASPLEPWVRAQLARAGVRGADGEILLQAFPRVLGYVFNPIAIFHCHDRAGALRAVLCEVSNTFGERHNYLLAHRRRPRHRARATGCTARKVFHVSPFCEVEGFYRFRFAGDEGAQLAHIDYHDARRQAPRHRRSTAGPSPSAPARSRSAFLGYPLMTAGVVARIHWQALRLWLKRVPWFSKPEPPLQETTR